MKRVILYLLTSTVISNIVFAQNSSNCVYWTMEDFLEDKCDESEIPYVDGIYDERSGVEKFVLKTKTKNKRLKKAFGALINGEMFYQIYPISRNLAKKDRIETSRNSSDFIRVLSWGLYDYMEYSGENSSGSGSGIGIGGGGVSTGIGIGLNLGGGGNGRVRGLIFDPENQEFNVFRNCKDFNEFLLERHPQYAYECKKKKINLNQVRAIIEQINGQGQQFVEEEVDIENSKLVTVFPHRNIVKYPCVLLIGDEKWEFDDLTVLETYIPCDEGERICIEGTDKCIEASCDDDVIFYMINRNRETKTYSLEPSNEEEHKYYTALLERRKSRKK